MGLFTEWPWCPRRRLCMNSATWTSSHQGHLATAIAERPTCRPGRPTRQRRVSDRAPFPRWPGADYTAAFPSREGSSLFVLGQTLLWIETYLPCTQCFRQNHRPWACRMPLPPLWCLTQHYFRSRNSLYSKWRTRWVPARGTRWSYRGPIVLKQNGRMPFGRLSSAAARLPCLAGLGQTSPGGCVCPESASNTWFCFSHSQDSPNQDSRGGKGDGPHTVATRDALGKFPLPVLATLCSACLEVLVPREECCHRETQQWFHWLGSWDGHPTT